MNKPAPTLTELYQLERLRSARLLPKNAGVVFVVSRVVDDVEKFDVRTVSLDGKSTRTIARDLDVCGGLVPSPDGSVFAFIGKSDGKPQICFMEPETGRIRPITSLPQGVGSPPRWSPCGEWLAFSALGEERIATHPFEPSRATHIAFRQDGFGVSQRAAQDIYVVSRHWSEVKRLTHGPLHHAPIAWSPIHGRLEIAFQTAFDNNGIDLAVSAGILTLDGNVRWLRKSTKDNVYGFGFASDGERMMLAGVPPGTLFGTPIELYVSPIAGCDGTFARETSRSAAFTRTTGGQVTNMVLSSFMGALGSHPISPAGKDYAFVCTEVAGRSSVYRISLSGEESCVPISPTDSGNYLNDADGENVLIAVTDFNAPPDLYVCAHDGTRRTRLTALNDAFLSTRTLPDVRHIRYQSPDGAKLEGWLISPAGIEGPVPTFVDIHGGPQCSWGPAWYHGAQMLASAGIATLLTNPRGSSGYGQAFASAIQGKYVAPADADILAAVDECVRLKLSDPERLAVGGISYGGVLSSWLVGQTKRFKCAVPEQLICNFLSNYGQSDSGRIMIQSNFGVSLKDGFDLLWKYSPLSHAHKVTTPTLVIQCEQDMRCVLGEGEQFFVSLLEAGCTAELLRIPNSSHGGPEVAGITKLSRPRDEAVIAWLSQYLKPNPGIHNV